MNEIDLYLLTDEQRLMLKTRKIREEILDNYIETEKLPTKTGEIRVITELLDSLDGNVKATADGRLKVKKAETDNETSAAILSVLKHADIEMLPMAERRGAIDAREFSYIEAELDMGTEEIENDLIDEKGE